MVAAGGAVICGNAREVADVLGEYGIAGGGRRAEHLGVGRSRESKVRHSGGLDSRGLQLFGDGGRIHLVDEDLHRVSAAAVSLR